MNRPLWLALALSLPACSDVSSFSTKPGEAYCGSIVQGPFVRSGFRPDVQMRLTFQADAVTTTPGVITTTDGLLRDINLKAIPQLSHDPLSTLQFGEGRRRNFLFVADSSDTARAPSVLAIVSLMESGDVEVRLVHGAPLPMTPQPAAATTQAEGAAGAAGAPTTAPAEPLFGVFPLTRQRGDCGF